MNFLEQIICCLILIRPFVSSTAFPTTGVVLSLTMSITCFIYIFTIPKDKIKISILDGTVLLFFLIAILSFVIHFNPASKINAIINFTSGILLFYAVRFSSLDVQKRIISTVIISAFFLSLYSIRAFFVVAPYLKNYMAAHNITSSFAIEFLARRRAFSPFITPNLLASYMVMTFLVTLGSALSTARSDKKRYIAFLGMITMAFTIVITKSISGGIILTICLGIFFVRSNLINLKTVFILFCFVIAVTTTFYIRSHQGTYFSRPRFSLSQRIVYWKETIAVIHKHPFTGVGTGNYNIRESRFAHNSYLQIWAEEGITGFLLWLCIVFLFLQRGIKKLKYSKVKNSRYELGLFLAGTAFLMDNLVNFSFSIIQCSFLWWIILAIIGEDIEDDIPPLTSGKITQEG